MTDNVSRWFTRREAAAYLKVSLPTFDRMVRADKVHKFSAAGTRSPRYDRCQLDRVMSSSGTGCTATNSR